jgi:transcriptional regulator with XRE-family HTH domain
MQNGDNLNMLEEENHVGHNVQRIRVYLGIKQDVLAKELGLSQPQISLIEQQKEIDDPTLTKISGVLGVSVDVIRKFNIEKAIYNICSNNYKDATINEGANTFAIAQQLNPLDKIVELYERLLKSEREKLEMSLRNN